jgi:hypothetical protein
MKSLFKTALHLCDALSNLSTRRSPELVSRHSPPLHAGDGYDPAVVLDLDYWVLMPL